MNNNDSPRYLSAKRTVDDRALNRPVWEALVHALAGHGPSAPQVLEIGAGTGAMFRRMIEWGALPAAYYTALDADPRNIQMACQELPDWGRARGMAVEQRGDDLVFSSPAGQVDLQLLTADVFDYLSTPARRAPLDLIVAHAFLDLLDVERILPLLRAALRPGGLLYLTINFDGLTAFEPVTDPALDEQIVALYHRSMDERTSAGQPSGDSRTGRRLFTHLRQAGFETASAGSSDWAVFPRHGAYPADEAFFLQFILGFFEQTLSGHPELDGAAFASWLAARRRQIACGELVFLAHQFDFLAVRPA